MISSTRTVVTLTVEELLKIMQFQIDGENPGLAKNPNIIMTVPENQQEKRIYLSPGNEITLSWEK